MTLVARLTLVARMALVARMVTRLTMTPPPPRLGLPFL
jgi:hypothetical protein